MNSLSIFSAAATTGQAVTMSSREIAELTGKEHKNVLADIRDMLESLGQTSADFSANLPDSYGRLQPAYSLPKRETLILVSGYSTELRARIIDRWQELEAKAAQPQPVALTQAEQDIRIAVLLADALNVAPSGRITMLGVALKHSAPHMLAALPAYAIDAPAKDSAPQSSEPPTTEQSSAVQPQVEQEPGYLDGGSRYKVTHLKTSGYCIIGLPGELLGCWVALVDATDNKHIDGPQPKREPLTDDDVERLWYQNRGVSLPFTRAIERAHGIGGET
jgi:phage regulator Rha-like protein